jgi:4-oxalomesaconate tautomerase
VRIRLVNTGSIAISTFATPGGAVYDTGTTAISGVPGTAAPVELDFTGTEGSVCASLLPTGRLRDEVDRIPVTCIDNGMPVVVVRASDPASPDTRPWMASRPTRRLANGSSRYTRRPGS